jgi:glycosyltransferase involved in cell wall biosynthesis
MGRIETEYSNRKTERISIIIPTKDRPILLKTALSSAYRQTWSNTEVILVDDGSNELSFSKLQREFPTLRIIRHTGSKGPSASRNAGVSCCLGDYIMFLDDDDLLHPNHVEGLLAASRAIPKGTIITGRWRKFQVRGSELYLGPIMCCPEDRTDEAALIEFFDPLGDGCICSLSVLWPREVVERVQWDEELFTNGDVDFFGRAVLAGYRIVGRPVGMAYYRQHDGERVAGTLSRRSLISSTRYRLKWSNLLSSHPLRELFERAMQNGFMSLIIAWSREEDRAEWIPILKDAYRSWGGQRYFIPNPPRNWAKRTAASAALRLGGPAALGRLLNLQRKSGGASGRALTCPVSSGDMDDADVIRSFL